jgi:SAM-dependent methyltransferase
MYEEIIQNLRKAYDQRVEERDSKEVIGWKVAEREAFLMLLMKEDKTRLLEIGSGPGVHAKFFQERGLEVVCIDLSPEMVRRCSEKGLEAYEMDFLNLGFPSSEFEAVYAMNCLLHVPRENLSQALEEIDRVLRMKGLFYWGQYGGVEQAGIYEGDHYRPKRFFSFIRDDQLQETAKEYFEIYSFKTIELETEENFHFQALALRKK